MGEGLSSRDWERLDNKFGEVHKRITDTGKEMATEVTKAREDATDKVNQSHNELAGQINAVRTDVEIQKRTPCKDVKGHEKAYHNGPKDQANGKPVKFWAMVTGVAAGVVTAVLVIYKVAESLGLFGGVSP